MSMDLAALRCALRTSSMVRWPPANVRVNPLLGALGGDASLVAAGSACMVKTVVRIGANPVAPRSEARMRAKGWTRAADRNERARKHPERVRG